MATQGKLRPYSLKPYDDGIGQGTADFLDWVQTTLNTLVGQRLAVGNSAQGFNALQNPQINPATQVSSTGGRTSRGSTIGFMLPAGGAGTTITFFYDGTHSTRPFQLFRDDGTSTTPLPGSMVVAGLSTSQGYTFYPYFDEIAGVVKFINNSDLSTALRTAVTVMVGTPQQIALPGSVTNINLYDATARQLTTAPNRTPLFTLQSAAANGPATQSGPPLASPNGGFGGTGLFLFTRSGSGY